MGQRTSKHHSPLTFGYVNSDQSPSENNSDAVRSGVPSNTMLDYVLNHPELYKLELVCQCTARRTGTTTQETEQGTAVTAKDEEEWVVATHQQECRICRQNKRMSLVRHNLAKDLEYIDETYYSGMQHYESIATIASSVTPANQVLLINSSYSDGDGDDDDDNEHINDHWAKVTVGEVTSQTTRNTSIGGGDHRGETSSLGTRLPTQSTSLTLDLSGRSLVKLSSGIGYLNNLTKLNLSNNQLSSLPKSIGYLNNLSILNASHNQLECLPDTIMYLTKLKAINVSHNDIVSLTASLGSLPELIIIIANNNKIKWVPKEIANLQKMISFNISNNPLEYLPAEIAGIKSLRKLIADGCDFKTEFIHQRQHDPPTLFEQCARTVIGHQLALPSYLADHIREYFSTCQECSYCRGPYFESFVTRGRFIERVARQPIALEYRLCRAHWDDDQDRLLNLFSTSCTTSLSSPPPPPPPALATPKPTRSASSTGGFNKGIGLMDTSRALSPSSSFSSASSASPQNARKRSASSSSNLSSYRFIPSLPPLPTGDTTPGSNSSSTSSLTPPSSGSSTPLPSYQHQQLARPNLGRPRANSSTSITKRLTNLLSPSRSSSSIMTRSRSHSSLRQEITPPPSSSSSSLSPSISTVAATRMQQCTSTSDTLLSPGERGYVIPLVTSPLADSTSSQIEYQNNEASSSLASPSVVLDTTNLATDSQERQPSRLHMLSPSRADILPTPSVLEDQDVSASPFVRGGHTFASEDILLQTKQKLTCI